MAGIHNVLGLVGIPIYAVGRFVKPMVAFAAGAMLAGALAHLFPKAPDGSDWAPEIAIIGFSSFFILERYLHWRHCHRGGNCDVHPMTTLTIMGDSIHNFIDGLVDSITGWMTTALTIGHEIPQEIGKFSVLVYGGYSKRRATILAFVAQASCILGGIIGWFFTPEWMVAPLIAFATGGFLYISASDLIPELHREKAQNTSLRSLYA